MAPDSSSCAYPTKHTLPHAHTRRDTHTFKTGDFSSPNPSTYSHCLQSILSPVVLLVHSNPTMNSTRSISRPLAPDKSRRTPTTTTTKDDKQTSFATKFPLPVPCLMLREFVVLHLLDFFHGSINGNNITPLTMQQQPNDKITRVTALRSHLGLLLSRHLNSNSIDNRNNNNNNSDSHTFSLSAPFSSVVAAAASVRALSTTCSPDFIAAQICLNRSLCRSQICFVFSSPLCSVYFSPTRPLLLVQYVLLLRFSSLSLPSEFCRCSRTPALPRLSFSVSLVPLTQCSLLLDLLQRTKLLLSILTLSLCVAQFYLFWFVSQLQFSAKSGLPHPPLLAFFNFSTFTVSKLTQLLRLFLLRGSIYRLAGDCLISSFDFLALALWFGFAGGCCFILILLNFFLLPIVNSGVCVSP